MKKSLLSLVAVFIILFSAMPANTDSGNQETVKEVVEYVEQDLLSQEGIAGISYTENPDKVVVYIESEEYRSKIPEKIKEYDTEIRVSGRFKALGVSQQSALVKTQQTMLSRTGRCEPLVGGISLGNENDFGCGTLGIVYEKGSEKYILSNTHVMAMDIDGGFNPKGTKIVQPGYLDGDGYVVGNLQKYSRIKWLGRNYVDAAIATCTVDANINELLDSDDLTTYNVDFENIYQPEVGDYVKKSGRTSGVTENRVIDTHATIEVFYENIGLAATFKDQILVTNPFSDPGDSGSVVTESEDPHRFVGLLFAASYYETAINKGSRVKQEIITNTKSKSYRPTLHSFLDTFPNVFPLLRLFLKVMDSNLTML